MKHFIISEMMYGALHSAVENPREEYRTAFGCSREAYEKLEEALTKEQQKLFEDFIEKETEEESEYISYILKLGFRTGFLLAMEACFSYEE